MQAHEGRKNFAEKYYPQGWREMRVSERKLELAQSLPSVSILCISQQNPQGLSLRSGRCANFAK